MFCPTTLRGIVHHATARGQGTPPLPDLFRWSGRLRPTQPAPEVPDDLPWRDRVDQVRALMDAFAPTPPPLRQADKFKATPAEAAPIPDDRER